MLHTGMTVQRGFSKQSRGISKKSTANAGADRNGKAKRVIYARDA
jgi:hypothetical protein